MIVRFWGTRGSLPTALRADAVRRKVGAAVQAAAGRRFEDGAALERFLDEELGFPASGTYGGATSCLEIDRGSGDFVVCDMGSGLREFGLDALKRIHAGRPATFHVFLSHPHWDHIMGFPFFVPAFIPGTRVHFYGGHDIEAVLRRQQDAPSFPVPLDYMRAEFSFHRLEPGAVTEVAGLAVRMIRQHHHGDSYGYRFEHAGRAVVYTTDAEHKLESDEVTDAHVEFLREADAVVFDTMYSLADAISVKEDWGHSSNIIAVDMCHRAEARRLVMFHHEPVFDDAMIGQMHRETVRYAELVAPGRSLEVLCAWDGMELRL
jgi:phosphoribosyl 1,2-cyclic phosphodiesterase